MLVRRVPSVSLGEVERDELLYTIEVVRAQVSRLFVDENVTLKKLSATVTLKSGRLHFDV